MPLGTATLSDQMHRKPSARCPGRRQRELCLSSYSSVSDTTKHCLREMTYGCIAVMDHLSTVKEGPGPRESMEGNPGALAPTEEKRGGLPSSLRGEGAAGSRPTAPQ